VNIYTAQYRYAGPDRLDITVKGNPDHLLSPTWNIVRALQEGKITQWDYTIKYFALLIGRLTVPGTGFQFSLQKFLDLQEITLVCFCPPHTFCHRVLAARMLEELGFGKYLGERPI